MTELPGGRSKRYDRLGERDDATVTTDGVPVVSAEEGRQMIEDGALLLDVREADEWDAGHAPEAVWIPMGELQARVEELPRDRRIVAICRSGARSDAVAAALLGAGLRRGEPRRRHAGVGDRGLRRGRVRRPARRRHLITGSSANPHLSTRRFCAWRAGR